MEISKELMIYLFEIKGRIFRDLNLPGMDPAQRHAIFAAMIGTLAKLHNIDWNKIGLGDYGPKSDYCKRQVDYAANTCMIHTAILNGDF